MVFKNGLADQYVVWFTDSNGNYQTAGAPVTGASWLVQGLEIPFGQDLNGDAQIGPVTANIESAGATTLAQVADSYFLYAHGTTSGPQLSQSGAYVVVGQSGTWTPLGVEVIQGGYQLVWKNTMAGADQYVTWTTDNNGNVVSSGAVMAGASPELKALEVSFQQDFNGNAMVGSSEPMMSMFGSAGAADLALFTNYMASAFATPAGEGGAGVGDGQSSLQPHLANPFA